MCRLVAYAGPPLDLSDLVIDPSHSLIAQSQDAQEAKLSVNGDGFGLAWYGNGAEPGIFKDILPAWSDANLLSLCQHIAAPLFMAHVRASTEGATARVNCHPFSHGRWSFMHNGQTGDFPALRRRLEALLTDDLYARRQGSTDSELMFLLLLNNGLQNDPELAWHMLIDQMNTAARAAGITPFLRQTCVFSDGVHLYCYRYASDGRAPTLYLSRQFAQGGLVIASEPLDGDDTAWSEIAPNRLMRFGEVGAETLGQLRAA